MRDGEQNNIACTCLRPFLRDDRILTVVSAFCIGRLVLTSSTASDRTACQVSIKYSYSLLVLNIKESTIISDVGLLDAHGEGGLITLNVCCSNGQHIIASYKEGNKKRKIPSWLNAYVGRNSRPRAFVCHRMEHERCQYLQERSLREHE